METNICALSLKQASELVRQRKLSPVEITSACLERIQRDDGRTNSFIDVYVEQAIAEARVAEREIAKGNWSGPLHGIPVAIKDLIDIKGRATTAASKLFSDHVATEDAGVVQRLRRAGAIIIGKNNLHEFAYGGSGVISAYGPVRNPRERSRITGGSSSGSAAAVASNFCFAAIGTDTAGSIRLPAACCGIVGLKPAFGRVSVRGVVPLSESYDHVGPLTRTVEDAELVFAAIADYRPRPPRGLRFAVARKYFFEGSGPAVVAAVEQTIEQLKREHEFVGEINVPVDEDRTLSSSESWIYHRQFVRESPELYDPRTLARIKSGERYTSEQISVKRRELERIRASVDDLFRDVDVIATPTSPILPPKFEDISDETLRPLELLMLRNTRPWNVYGVPAISVPCGEMIGVQLAGRSESDLLTMARSV